MSRLKKRDRQRHRVLSFGLRVLAERGGAIPNELAGSGARSSGSVRCLRPCFGWPLMTVRPNWRPSVPRAFGQSRYARKATLFWSLLQKNMASKWLSFR